MYQLYQLKSTSMKFNIESAALLDYSAASKIQFLPNIPLFILLAKQNVAVFLQKTIPAEL